MFKRNSKKKKNTQKQNQNPATEPTTPAAEETKKMPNGLPWPDFQVEVNERGIKLLTENDELVEKLTKQLQEAKVSRRQIVRALASVDASLPEESTILFDFDVESKTVMVWKKDTIAKAQAAIHAKQQAEQKAAREVSTQ